MPVSVSDERTVTHVLRQAVARFPDRVWIAHETARLTFGDVDDLSTRLANGYRAHGMLPGDTVLFMLPDLPDYVAAWVACSKSGVVEVPVNTAYRGDILVHLVNDSKPGRWFAEPSSLTGSRVSAAGSPILNASSSMVATRAPPGRASHMRSMSFRLRRLCRTTPFRRTKTCAKRDLKAVMYTSGTTGPSKGVMVSQAHAYEYAAGCAECLEVGAGDVYYTAGLPLFHVAGKWGVVYAAAIHGATAAFPKRFSAGRFWQDVGHYGATTTFLLGAMANFLQRQPADDADCETPLEKVLMCPLLPDVEKFASRFGARIATAYGSTEVNAPVFMAPGRPVHDVQYVGRVRSEKFEVQILDEQDREVGADVLGEIAVRPKEPWITMLGYWGQPEHTVNMWRNQWLHSGDAGRRDADGGIYFVDRIKDAIRRRGENISSMEVEGIVSQHPAVAECAVYPVASEHSEQDVAVAVVCKSDAGLDMEEFVRWLEPKMAYFMVPRYVTVLDDLPKTPTGKIQKYTLREHGVTSDTWDREASGLKLAR